MSVWGCDSPQGIARPIVSELGTMQEAVATLCFLPANADSVCFDALRLD